MKEQLGFGFEEDLPRDTERSAVTYSHSRLSTFENCPKRYQFKYVQKIKREEEFEGIEAYMGTRVHEVLEKLYKDLLYTKRNTLPDLLKYYNDLWERNWHPHIKIVKEGFSKDHYRQLGEDCISGYFKRYAPFDHSRTLGLEQMVQIRLDREGRYRLMGFIDRLAQASDGEIEIHDYKTSGTLPLQEDLDSDRQLALYQMAIQSRFPETNKVHLIWHYLVFDKELRSYRDNEALEQLKTETIRLIHQVESATHQHLFPPVESALCNWCEYRDICPVWKHLYQTKYLPLNQFMQEEGVNLANLYMDRKQKLEELGQEIQKIEEEMERLKEAILAYCKKSNVEVLFGSDYKLKVKLYKNVKYPGKDDPQRQELKLLLKDAGLWEEVSELDTFKLKHLQDAGFLSPEVTEKIRAYQSFAEVVRIYPAKNSPAE